MREGTKLIILAGRSIDHSFVVSKNIKPSYLNKLHLYVEELLMII